MATLTGTGMVTAKGYGPMGDVYYITLYFDGFEASLGAKKPQERIAQLQQYVNQDSDEWAFKDMGTFDDGAPKPLRVISYPGKPQWNGESSDGGATRPAPPSPVVGEDVYAVLSRIEGKLDALTAFLILTPAGGGAEGEDGPSPVSEGEGEPSGSLSFEDLALKVGSRGGARALINSTVGSTYTAMTVLNATPVEIMAAFAALEVGI